MKTRGRNRPGFLKSRSGARASLRSNLGLLRLARRTFARFSGRLRDRNAYCLLIQVSPVKRLEWHRFIRVGPNEMIKVGPIQGSPELLMMSIGRPEIPCYKQRDEDFASHCPAKLDRIIFSSGYILISSSILIRVKLYAHIASNSPLGYIAPL